MRHIVISIILILAFLSSEGQTQQVLKNGFVVATNDGVWYLQDGFNEWVKLDYFRGNASDTTNGVCVSDGVVYTDNLVTLEGSGSSTDRSIFAVYGNKISSGDRGGREINLSQFKTQTLTSGFKQYKSIVRINYDRTVSNMSVLIGYPPVSGAVEYSYNEDNVQYYSSCDGDNDSIFVWVGTNNILYKGVVTEFTANRTMNSISGLHSRPTDSHKITYNPDDDIFIIVSDSGIVYSYDKTTLTTIDTLSNCIKVMDIEYGGGYIYVVAKYIDTNSYRVYTSSNLTTWNESETQGGVINSFISCVYSDYIDKILVMVGDGTTASSLFFDSSGTYTFGEYLFKIPFDLDYINYLPD